ncbi:MAG: hypothetical protein HZC41_25450 [Chloroflexi bacterium]|nr:hypothetical protein [Chloroflexota bacterium]
MYPSLDRAQERRRYFFAGATACALVIMILVGIVLAIGLLVAMPKIQVANLVVNVVVMCCISIFAVSWRLFYKR